MLVRASLATLVMLAACSSNSTPNTPDAAGPTVMAVACPATVPLTVDAPDSGLMFVFGPQTHHFPSEAL